MSIFLTKYKMGKIFHLTSSLGLLRLLLFTTALVKAAQEPRTGIIFRDRLKGRPLKKFGVHSIGPNHVYAVGQYGERTFLLQLSCNSSAKDITSMLLKAVKVRCDSKDADKVEEFESLMLSSFPNGAPKGTSIFFSTVGRKLSMEINGKYVGTIDSNVLSKAFSDIYTGTNKVCIMRPVDNNVKCGSQNLDSMIGYLQNL